jgi:hypothetical protein
VTASNYRIGVQDDHASGVTLWYDQESAETTYTVWRLLQDYGRDGIDVTVQIRGTDGAWRTVNPPLVTRPHDWPHDE